jgi:DNA-binding GntR family transcriptional regulator
MFDESTSEHREIIDAIGAGDPARAQLAMVRNWANAVIRLSGVIEQSGELGTW